MVNTGRTVAQMARELGVLEATLGPMGQRVQGPPGCRRGVLSEGERVESARLRKENQDLKLDRAFLKKASVDSSGQCNTVLSA